MNPLEYLRLQLRLEGREIIQGNFLRQVEVVPDEEMPLMLLVQLVHSKIIAYFDETLQPELRVELMQQVSRIIFPNIDPLSAPLQTRNISFEVGHYKTYLFPPHVADLVYRDVICLLKQDPLVQVFGFGNFAEQVYVIERDGQIASACVSTRENGQCGEAWVYTDPQHRNHGFAQRVVSVWAQQMIKAGKVPFYSHKIENTASANLAKRLELQPIFDEIVISSSHVPSSQ